ncbi:monovalent cation/H+ antiporter subunit A [Ancylobacter rudongensis]|uniref:Multisubunit potassium/proton antiporter, PhaA subunit (TC 2.A.63.1.1)/multisubunit potassium/proton antiporter, PhaB subunit (TC 2.A.63.1.1) n=1 Tax=Ancylobacter rudongensis TaxID=177413 RepID=A0A1G4PP70_9HYPH|nr:monovalent cation/H+ antiporter subunit A [Ancylobacter rudongensis]SCW33849.1 multisubunit potassium/proton antiporter, PhaA subunit (TC 2.A.63.1.1)/multisubunit potassium/proton antiporter, PhaB subunit (TC 2.A.63.1.1) [Ancylobacter rudongensis]
MPHDTLLLVALALPFLGSLAAGFLPTHARNAAAVLAGSVAVAGMAITIGLYATVAEGAPVQFWLSWLPMLGLDFSLRLDGLAWLFAMMIFGIGALVVLYARYYMSREDPVPRFFSFLLAFMGSMIGIVLSGNLIQLVFFWELTSLFSFLLIGYWHHSASARDGARMALTVTGTGGLCLLVGVLLVGRIVGSYDIDQVLESRDLIVQSDLYVPALVLILLGAFTKSAQFPFHFWLPHAMAAPTPVSAYLHSATMVKAGIFLLMRLWPVMSGTDAWFYMVVPAGLVTLLLGAFIAIFQQDLKGLLAYSTISHLGLITLLLGLGSPLAAVAAIFHTLNHAIFKASLFMAAGIIDHETGTRDLRKLSGLYRYMPFTATLAMVAAAAMAGVPLLNGFISKEMFFAEAVADHTGSLLDDSLPYWATLAGVFSVTYSLRFILGVFFGPPPVDLPHRPHEPAHWMRFPIELLVLICLLIGIVPSLTVGPALATAVKGLLDATPPYYSLALWHGFNLPLMMSLIAMAGGVVLYLGLRRYLESGIEGPPILRDFKGQRIFEKVLATLSWQWARAAESALGTRRLQPQMRIVICLAVVAALAPFLANGAVGTGDMPGTPLPPAFALLWLIGGACALGAAYQAKYHRFAALVLVGGAGLVTCLTFVWLSAPDLAVTQLLVEIVTTVLLLLGLRWLPKRIEDVYPTRPPLKVLLRRYVDITIACALGGVMAFLAYCLMTRPLTSSVSRFFVERAYSEGGGTNIINVILVDFRGFDTMGEIVVLCLAALTVFALLRRFRPAPESIRTPEQQRIQNAYDEASPDRSPGDTVADYMLIPRLIMHWLFPVIAVMAVYLFMRGHDLPGGGFAAGITLSIAFVVQYMASGARWVEDHLRVLPLRWMGLGLLTSCATGVGSWWFGYPFLTSHFQYVELPLIGKMPAASALLFDLGVFALVVGATVLILIALAHQSLRSSRAAQANEGSD